MSNENDVILEFPDGLLGFPEMKRFRIYEPPDGYPLKFLQSVDSPEISFICMDPAGVKADYEFSLGSEDAVLLDLQQPDDALVLTLVVIPEDPKEMTTNLAGPLVINVKTRQGRQIVLPSDQYPIKHKIISAR